jgi:hypothetical protein
MLSNPLSVQTEEEAKEYSYILLTYCGRYYGPDVVYHPDLRGVGKRIRASSSRRRATSYFATCKRARLSAKSDRTFCLRPFAIWFSKGTGMLTFNARWGVGPSTKLKQLSKREVGKREEDDDGQVEAEAQNGAFCFSAHTRSEVGGGCEGRLGRKSF